MNFHFLKVKDSEILPVPIQSVQLGNYLMQPFPMKLHMNFEHDLADQALSYETFSCSAKHEIYLAHKC